MWLLSKWELWLFAPNTWKFLIPVSGHAVNMSSPANRAMLHQKPFATASWLCPFDDELPLIRLPSPRALVWNSATLMLTSSFQICATSLGSKVTHCFMLLPHSSREPWCHYSRGLLLKASASIQHGRSVHVETSIYPSSAVKASMIQGGVGE